MESTTEPFQGVTQGSTWTSPCLVSLHSKVMWSPLPNHFRRHSRIHLDFTLLTTTCFQFSMLNIYHASRCHLKDKAIMWPTTCLFCFVTLRPPKGQHIPPPLPHHTPLHSWYRWKVLDVWRCTKVVSSCLDPWCKSC